MKLVNKGKTHVVIHNGVTYEKIDAGKSSSDLPESAAADALARFKELSIHKARVKKAPKVGADKMMDKVED